MKKSFLVLVCIFAISGLAGCFPAKEMNTNAGVQMPKPLNNTHKTSIISSNNTHKTSIISSIVKFGLQMPKPLNNTQTSLKIMEAERDGIIKKQGSSESYYAKNCPIYLTFWQQAAQEGQAIAQGLLAGCYDSGIGVALAQFNLGVEDYYGERVTKNENEAVIWFSKAAEQGLALAQFNLGVMYYSGQGVTKNENEAVILFKKAAEQGLAQAQFNLGLSYAEGIGTTKDESKAVGWYMKAAEQGDVDAQYHLGIAYENGEGVAKDKEQAIIWYRKAAELGNVDAQANLKAIYKDYQAIYKEHQLIMASIGQPTKQNCLNIIWSETVAIRSTEVCKYKAGALDNELQIYDLLKCGEVVSKQESGDIKRKAIVDTKNAITKEGRDNYCESTKKDYEEYVPLMKKGESCIAKVKFIKEGSRLVARLLAEDAYLKYDDVIAWTDKWEKRSKDPDYIRDDFVLLRLLYREKYSKYFESSYAEQIAELMQGWLITGPINTFFLKKIYADCIN